MLNWLISSAGFLCSSLFVRLKVRDKASNVQKYDNTDGSSDDRGLSGVISIIISSKSGAECSVENQPQPDCCSKAGFCYLEVQYDLPRHRDTALNPDGECDTSRTQTDKHRCAGERIRVITEREVEYRYSSRSGV